MKHELNRVRHELRRRALTVQSVERITPNMLRIVAGGDDMADFISLSPDDHLKLIVPVEGGEMEMRDYTPRRFDIAARHLTIDFAVHDAGPATRWALDARAGDTMLLAGPRGSLVVPQDFDWWLLVGDETALPAIGRRIEELGDGTPVTSIIAVSGPAEEQQFATLARHKAIWVHRPLARANDPAPLLEALKAFTPPPGDGFVWIAAEAGVARAARAHVVEGMGHKLQWLKASGYWLKGKADTTEKFE